MQFREVGRVQVLFSGPTPATGLFRAFLGTTRFWYYIMELIRETTTSISVVQARENGP